ncbi:GNAT family N-acetyltransferase [Bacillus licheniformis]|nr:GNAT family N-acetyltransferase [Bacillus licheniformis]
MNEKQEAVGYGLASIKKDLVSDCLSGQIDEVYIAPDYRRNKLGKLVADRMMDWFEQHQVSHVQVSVDIDNQSALHFGKASASAVILSSDKLVFESSGSGLRCHARPPS